QSAVLAGLGRGDDAPSGESERARWRRQALEWLRADLGLWRKMAESRSGPQRLPVRQALNHLGTHHPLVGGRNAEAQAILPEAERREWQNFWADIATLLGQLDGKPSGG